MNSELAKLQELFTANKLKIDIEKSNFVVFHPSRIKQKVKVIIKLSDDKTSKFIYLEQKNYDKYLGVLLDNKLSWKPHIYYISNKISEIVGILSKLRHSLPKDILLKMYKSLFQPLLLYATNIWDQVSKKRKSKLLLLQKRALRLIFLLSAVPLFTETEILPVTLILFNCSI